MNKADTIRLNLRWIRETEEKIKALKAEIAAFEIEKMAYNQTIMELEEVIGEDT